MCGKFMCEKCSKETNLEMGNKRNRSRQKKQKGRVINVRNKQKALSMNARKRTHEGNGENSNVSTPLKKGRPAQLEATEVERKTVHSLLGKKLQDSSECQAEKSDDYNLIINFEILKGLIAMIGCCPSCKSSDINIENVFNLRMGFQSTLQIHCSQCTYKYAVSTSKQCSQVGRGSSGRQMSEINVRTIVAFREIGCGHRAIENFSRIMNMQSISVGAFARINDSLYETYETAAQESMKKAGEEVFSKCKEKIKDGTIGLTQCSLDGTWQKRGHNSVNGVVTAVAEGKCIDFKVLSKYCKGCALWEQRKESPLYMKWKENHNCQANHSKSSGAMEAVGAIEIFSSSVDKHSLIYKKFLGDGDSSSFKEVFESNPYSGYNVQVSKMECVGHVQKRLGTRLRNIREVYKKRKPSLSGRGKLTDKVINSMQNFYGMAIRENRGELYQMKKAVGAILWHCTDFADEEYRHRFCPNGDKSWCKWRKHQSANDAKKQKIKINLPKWIHDIIKPIFEDLSRDELLSKCLHGQTQNANESLNNMIWLKCPKRVFVKRSTLEMGVNAAVLDFNEGAKGLSRVLQQYCIDIGVFMLDGSDKRNKVRVQSMKRKAMEKTRKRRKQLRSIKKGFIDAEKEKESSVAYKPGTF